MKKENRMDERERLEHEILKGVLKMAIMNNHGLTHDQKQQAMDNIDAAAQRADWIIAILRQCRYIA